MNKQRWAGLFCVVALLIACSSSDDASKDSLSAAPGDGNPNTTIVIGPDGSSSVVELPADGTVPAGGTTPNNGDGGGTPAAIDPGGPVGSFAPMVLQAARAGSVEVDVRQQSGASPQQGSIDHVVSVLQQVTGKTIGTSGDTLDGGAQSWSADDLRALGAAGDPQQPGRAVLHLLFVHGSFGGDDSVLGVSVQADTAAIFVDEVRATATPLVGSAGIEAAVVMHEVGHLMGLVDLYLHTGRQDPDHPGHSTDKNSVMYWAVESNIVTQLLQGGPPRDFDSADLADLATIRNGG